MTEPNRKRLLLALSAAVLVVCIVLGTRAAVALFPKGLRTEVASQHQGAPSSTPTADATHALSGQRDPAHERDARLAIVSAANESAAPPKLSGQLPTNVQGRVFGASQEPLEGAWIESIDRTMKVLSGHDGSFVFPVTRSDKASRLAVGHSGFVRKEIEIMPGRGIDVHLQSGTQLAGTVYIQDDEGSRRPAAGALISFGRSRRTLGYTEQLMTDAGGAFQIVDAPGTTLNLEIYAPGAIPWRESLTLGFQPVVHTFVIVPPREHLLVSVLAQDSKEPVVGATIRCNRAVCGTTNDKGQLALQYHANQLNSVEAHAAGFGLRTKGFEPANEPLPPELTIELVRATSVSGVILGEEGQPVVGARITLRVVRKGGLQRRQHPGVSGDWNQEATTDEYGRYLLGGLASNEGICRFVVAAAHPAYVPGESELIEVGPGELVSSITIRLRRGVKVAGVVTSEGKPVEAIVRILESGNTVFTDDTGYYEFPGISPGEYRLCAHLGQHPGVQACATTSVLAGADLWLPLSIEVSTQIVSGTVLTKEGIGIDDVEVRCTQPALSETSPMVYSTRTSRNGSFRFELKVAPQPAPFRVGVNRWKGDCVEEGVTAPSAVHLVCEGSASVTMVLRVAGTDIPPTAYAIYWLAEGKTLEGDEQVYCEDVRELPEGKLLVVIPSGKGIIRVTASGHDTSSREVHTRPGEYVSIGLVELEVREIRR